MIKLKRLLLEARRAQLREELEDVILYHGSNKEFSEFDDAKISSGEGSDLFGKGYYLTDNEEVGKFYGKLVTKKEKITGYDATGIFGTDMPNYSDDADDHANKNFKVNRFRVHGNILNVEEFQLDDGFIECLKDSYMKHSGWGEEGVAQVDRTIAYMRQNRAKIRNFRGELLYVIHQLASGDQAIVDDLVRYIKSKGYDGLKYKPDKGFEGNLDSWNYVIYNKTAFKKV